MALKSDLESDIGNVFSQSWEETVGRVVPVPNDVGLNNKVVFLENAVVLYADLDGSTKMVAENKWEFSAEIYKSFLLSAAKIIKSENGAITSYDGDRIMAIFIGAEKYDRAVISALKIRWVVLNVIQPRMQKSWSTEFKVKHTVGIDASNLRAVRTGVRGDNDLVWVGNAANWAAKLTTLPNAYSTYITQAVYQNLSGACKISNNKSMWELTVWSQQNNKPIYRSHWNWGIN